MVTTSRKIGSTAGAVLFATLLAACGSGEQQPVGAFHEAPSGTSAVPTVTDAQGKPVTPVKGSSPAAKGGRDRCDAGDGFALVAKDGKVTADKGGVPAEVSSVAIAAVPQGYENFDDLVPGGQALSPGGYRLTPMSELVEKTAKGLVPTEQLNSPKNGDRYFMVVDEKAREYSEFFMSEPREKGINLTFPQREVDGPKDCTLSLG